MYPERRRTTCARLVREVLDEYRALSSVLRRSGGMLAEALCLGGCGRVARFG
jgi:hypothetical protein